MNFHCDEVLMTNPISLLSLLSILVILSEVKLRRLRGV
jgi:hypothetical protein